VIQPLSTILIVAILAALSASSALKVSNVCKATLFRSWLLANARIEAQFSSMDNPKPGDGLDSAVNKLVTMSVAEVK